MLRQLLLKNWHNSAQSLCLLLLDSNETECLGIDMNVIWSRGCPARMSLTRAVPGARVTSAGRQGNPRHPRR